MLSAGKLLYVTDYDFGEDHPNRNKYLIVIHNSEQVSVLLALTTSVCHIPDRLLNQGCIKEDPSNIHSYFFPAKETLSACGFHFSKHTFVDINSSQVFERATEHINEKYIEQGKIEEKCLLLDKHYHELLYCIYKSKFIAKKTKSKLEIVLARLANNLQGKA